MSDNFKIKACAESGCGWKCCSFATDGYIVILPKELDGRTDINHLKIIEKDSLGGIKAKCVANDKANSDRGYKPIMCRSYPLWVKNIKHNVILKSDKCPLCASLAKESVNKVYSMFKEYEKRTNIDLDRFLSYSYVDRYSLMENNDETIILGTESLENILHIEKEFISNPVYCMKSSSEDICKSLSSGCSYGIIKDGRLAAFSLCYHSDYCTGYIDKCFVLPDFRGNGYQQILLKNNICKLASIGVYNIYAMVSPLNMASLKSFTNVGFKIEREIRFDELRRYILRLEI